MGRLGDRWWSGALPRPRRGCRWRRTSRVPRSPRSRGISAVTRPSWRTMIRSDMARISGRSLEMRMIARPDAASSEMRRWTSTLAPMSMPRVGSSRIRTRGSGCQPLGQDDLLLVAAGQRTDLLVHAGHSDVELLRVLRGDSALGPGPDEKAGEQARQDRQRDVLGDGEVEDEAFLVAVLRQVGDALVHGGRRGREVHEPATEADLAAVTAVDARTGPSRSRCGRRPRARRARRSRPREPRTRRRGRRLPWSGRSPRA